jgi:hypothetical protein
MEEMRGAQRWEEKGARDPPTRYKNCKKCPLEDGGVRATEGAEMGVPNRRRNRRGHSRVNGNEEAVADGEEKDDRRGHRMTTREDRTEGIACIGGKKNALQGTQLVRIYI